MSATRTLAVSMAQRAIRAYQRLAPGAVRRACRFQPSCSEYALEALQRYGLLRGTRLAMARLWRCQPPNGGIDYP